MTKPHYRQLSKVLGCSGTLEPIYPAIGAVLQIFTTLPVTTATGERSFSALKYLKNYLDPIYND
jgi:hypothetical protein